MRRILIGSLALAALAALGARSGAMPVAGLNGDGAPDVITANAGSDNVSVLLGNGGIIPGQYIILFTEGVEPGATAAGLAREHGLQIRHVYRYALNGFAATVPEGRLQALERDPRVQNVVPDRAMHSSAETTPTGIDRIDAEGASPSGGGDYSAVRVAILDKGIDLDHPDLNVSSIWKNCAKGNDANDKDGHGTHVSGILAAKAGNGIGVRGVAPGATLYAVRVLNGGGSDSTVICGIDWVMGRRVEFNNGAGDGDPGINIAVANMSVARVSLSSQDTPNCGDPNSDGIIDDPLHRAICNSTEAGIIYVASAGNLNQDADNHAPATYDEVITVSAIADYNGAGGGGASPTCDDHGPDDSFATFSNFGADVDVASPGVCILSTYKGGGYATLSGTSQAAPHVAGALVKLIGDGALSVGPSSDPMAARNAAMSALLTKPQTDLACGYAPDSEGQTGGPLVYVGQPGTNCGALADSDGDGWSDASELIIGTDPLDGCADDPSDDAWPVDFNNDTFINSADLSEVASVIGQAVPPAPNRRDIDPDPPDQAINSGDLSQVAAVIGQSCAS